MLINDVGFYYSHQVLHHKVFHNSITNGRHPFPSCLENLFSNILPIIMSNLIVRYTVAWCWPIYAFGLVTTLGVHSRYHLPFLYSPLVIAFLWHAILSFLMSLQFHLHLAFTENFGSTGCLDWLDGTCVLRHQTFF